MPEENENINNIKTSIEHIIGANTQLKKRRKNLHDIEKDNFVKIITNLEAVYARSCITGDLMIDTSKYDEGFFQIIDALIEMHFGKEISEIIGFYLYDRIDIEGNISILHDENKEPIKLDNAHDLFILVKRINSKIDDESSKKKK